MKKSEIVKNFTVGCLSGLKRQFAKLLWSLKATEGSNPSPTAILKRVWCNGSLGLFQSPWEGSIPSTRSNLTGDLHNGSAEDFESSCRGSIPLSPANLIGM